MQQLCTVEDEKALALAEISKTINEFNQVEATKLLNKAIIAIAQTPDSDDKVYAIEAVAEYAANQKNWGQADISPHFCLRHCCVAFSLSEVLKTYAEQQYPQMNENNKV